eukprot:12532646-Alexandrium_andersonii.AAC.1
MLRQLHSASQRCLCDRQAAALAYELQLLRQGGSQQPGSAQVLFVQRGWDRLTQAAIHQRAASLLQGVAEE